jgi:S-adenosylmethionine:tRNA ribosyltransferase-isomerase
MPHDSFSINDYDFELPEELIAQYPATERASSRLFVLDRSNNRHVHTKFSFLPSFLQKDDLLVFNDTKVMHARIQCVKSSGGKFEIILTRRHDDYHWLAIASRMKRLKQNETVFSCSVPRVAITILNRIGDEIEIVTDQALSDELLSRVGTMALPPYIKRTTSSEDITRYQTVYARHSGAVAAPTAGLHFTESLLDSISAMGVGSVFITLKVSWGTFQPVRVNDIRHHAMHSESYVLENTAADTINDARGSGRRIIAVGTTSLRVLEGTFQDGKNIAGNGDTSIFIYPPYKIRSADCLITNFHTPRSTLLMLVSAFAGYETIMDAYREAINMKYRFFSYGDAMLIL